LPVDSKNLEKRGRLTEYRPSKKEMSDLRTEVAKQMNSTTSNPLEGVVAVFINTGFMGYAALKLTSTFSTVPITSDLAKAARVTLPSAAPGPDFELAIANASEPFLGTDYGYQGSEWGPGLPGYGSMTVVQHSTYPATNRNNPTGYPSESRVWNIVLDPSSGTGQLSLTWFNDDGTPVNTTSFWDATYGDLNFAGDLTQFLKVYPDNNCYITTLYWVPLSYFGL